MQVARDHGLCKQRGSADGTILFQSMKSLVHVITKLVSALSFRDSANPRHAVTFMLAIWIVATCKSLGQAPPTESDAASEFEKELKALQRRVQQLEEANQKLETAPRQTKTDDGKEPKVTKSSAKHTTEKTTDTAFSDGWIDVSDEKWNVKFGGHVQLDYVNWVHAAPSIPDSQDYFSFRRLRMVADGTGYGMYDFRLQLSLEPEGVGESPVGSVTTGLVRDAYFTVNEIPWLGRFRIGNFFVPFGLEQVTNDTNNIFLERSIPTQGVFCADREVGIAFYNCSNSQDVTWTTGLFFDSISEATKKRLDDNQGLRISQRLTWLPFYDEPTSGRYLFHTGAGVLYTHDHDNRVRFRARPQVAEGPRIIDSGLLIADSFTTGNLEAAFVYGRMAIQSEIFLSGIEMLQGDARTANGAYLHASWFITGENRIFERFGQHGAQFSRNVPFSNFFMTRGGISPGALELKARWSHLDLNNLDQGQYNDLTLGFNWYWSDRTRMMFDWIHPVTSADAVFGETQSDLLAMRFDFNW